MHELTKSAQFGAARIIARYQAYHVSYQLKLSSMNLPADQSESGIKSSVSHQKLHVGNFNLTGHVTSLISCKDSNQNLSDLRKKNCKGMCFRSLHAEN